MSATQLPLPLRWEHCPRCGYRFPRPTEEDRIVTVLRQAARPMYGTAIGDMLGWSKAHIYRILARMVAEGRISKVGLRGGYGLGCQHPRQPVPQRIVQPRAA